MGVRKIKTQAEESSLDSEALVFLGRDFDQCFIQLRHYDSQIVDIVKFAFTAYTAAVGSGLALYKYGEDKQIDYSIATQSVLVIGGIIGLCLLGMLNRNRLYFVVVARYINSQRKFFLKETPLGYRNPTGFYAGDDKPAYFNWKSSHAFLMYALSAANAFILAIVVSIQSQQDFRSIWIGIATFAIQATSSIIYPYNQRKEKC